MARLFIDGFESGGVDLWDYSTSVSIVTASTYGMTGSYAASVPAGNVNSRLQKDIGSKSEVYVAFKLRMGNDTSYQTIAHFRDSAGTLIASLLRNTSSAFLEIHLGNRNTTTLDTGSIFITNNTNFLIEMYYKPLNSGGVFTVKVNGIEDLTYTGDTTAGLENVQHVAIGSDGVGGSGLYADDVVIDDAGWIGQTFIQGIIPTGAGTTTQWDPSTGSNYACVDEKPASDTDFVSTNVTDEIDTYAMGDLTGEIGEIKCIQVQSRSFYEGAPTPTHQRPVVRSGGTNYAASADKTVTVVAKGIFHIWELNPADSASWATSDVNGIEAGIKATA